MVPSPLDSSYCGAQNQGALIFDGRGGNYYGYVTHSAQNCGPETVLCPVDPHDMVPFSVTGCSTRSGLDIRLTAGVLSCGPPHDMVLITMDRTLPVGPS